MRNKKLLKRIFPLIAIAVLLPWPIAYAHDVSDGVIGEETVSIEVADPSALPSWTAFGKAIGGVDEPGDLFYIDATDQPINITTTLYITNAKQLSHCYQYLILKVGVYTETSAGEWERTSDRDTFITLRNGQVRFTLPGCANYKVTIDDGSFNCITAQAEEGSVSPNFYLTVD